ncbi:ANTAR domain-containing protein [Streptomyces sp. NEAU-YJ-81]|uniref:ANTAR domain-containing protein n=1 Tax=Streptomyces sp. NEAU-YJ-81 TaxID=2820288 RepID=UPI001ABCB5AE|nr:ANTAR domain-containing protein [Streptomyces sp. NEAU-YJ-81]MBO3680450.1 ANTAR domain-containing protein [Streptomyces sp. NEAU-YJ-81]
MQRASVIQEEWWEQRAEATWGNAPAGQDVVALRAENDQLRRALAGRAVIDQARGMVMVLTPCRRGAAGDLLVDVSRQCDAGLPEVAAALVGAWEGKPLPGRIQRELRRTLRRFHAENQGCDSRQPGGSSR